MEHKKRIILGNTSKFFYLLCFLYLILPSLVSLFLPDNFYVFYKNSHDGMMESIFFFFLFVGLFTIIRFVNIDAGMTKSINMVGLFKILHIIHVVYLFIVLLIGLKFRLASGATRPELLELISSFFFPGYSYLLVASVCFLVIRAKGIYMLLIGLFFLLLDFAYMGKIFTLLFLVTWMMWADYHNKSGKIFFRGLLLGGSVAVAIFVIREIVVKGTFTSGLNLYVFFSEFIGVFASIGWAEGYHAQGLPMQILDFNAVLEPFYASSISHGLALHPAAYFVGNFGDFWILAAIIYTFLLALFSFFTIRSLGFLYVIIFIVNSVHFFRHGPDVFAKNVIVQSIFFVLLILLAKVFTIIAKDNLHLKIHNDTNSSE
ncbi:hypothetical protein O3297_19245 [Janthinobacterium sp. SUN128]|uniref:hypothetical protein n=1 Tax=Janthinobacterium sp. SUN128 TaxID=3014790 RepID=UPI002714155B|nr:hypothetical protein [Janthinobacterium sp. SUN128]MDO8035557.1 hypothetical protein [Janthinobacterium sp. SUN128]